MKIVQDLPPNIDAILTAFPRLQPENGVIFAYGDTIYSLATTVIAPHLIAHEEMHGARQRRMGVEEWWDQYLADKNFRLLEETAAHQVEWEAYRAAHNRAQSRRYLVGMAERLSGPLYGNLITRTVAKGVIKQGVSKE